MSIQDVEGAKPGNLTLARAEGILDGCQALSLRIHHALEVASQRAREEESAETRLGAQGARRGNRSREDDHAGREFASYPDPPTPRRLETNANAPAALATGAFYLGCEPLRFAFSFGSPNVTLCELGLPTRW